MASSVPDVCSEDGQVILVTDTKKMTVRQFDDLVLKKKLNFVEPDVEVGPNILISSDKEDGVDHYGKYLSDFNIGHGSIISVDDFSQKFSIKVKLHHKDWVNEEDDLFEIFANEDDIEKKSKNKPVDDNDCILDKNSSSGENISIVDGIIIDEVIAVNKDVVDEDMVTDENLVAGEIKKRKAEDQGTEESKKICVE